jgi:hypothetical protein
MHRVKHPPVRNKIDLTDPGQLRAMDPAAARFR